ncbi:hypothetical protein C8F04DRAFT_1174653 [Mycena alexandri]|uniref:Uncharacterized protein n=1 Tax=Mycena alexandri TaxID=1745969 RepID=A0AAD6TEA5_9AGAR|nr:hypothetical protein C8F04DRAFT_1174653 [Mycena alexandri]
MTNVSPVASGTEHNSVAAAAPPNNEQVMQFLTAAMATLSQAQPGLAPSAPAPAPAAAAVTPAPAPPPYPVDAAAAPVVAPGPTFQTRGPWVAGALFIVVPPVALSAIPEDPLVDDESSPLWYAITKGTFIGVTLSNPLALAATVGVSGSRMKSYKSQALALAAFNEMLNFALLAVIPK